MSVRTRVWMTVTPMPSVTIWREPLSVAVSVDIGEMARSVNVSAAKSIIKYMELNPPPKKKQKHEKHIYNYLLYNYKNPCIKKIGLQVWIAVCFFGSFLLKWFQVVFAFFYKKCTSPFTAVGLCSCFGDPHCISFDQRWLHFQGDCQYVMSKDGCHGTTPTYQVLTTHWNQDRPEATGVSWVKSVTVILPGYVWLLRFLSYFT